MRKVRKKFVISGNYSLMDIIFGTSKINYFFSRLIAYFIAKFLASCQGLTYNKMNHFKNFGTKCQFSHYNVNALIFWVPSDLICVINNLIL